MRNGVVAVAVFVALGHAGLAQPGDNGPRLREFKSTAGNFRADFPERPESDSKQLSLGAGSPTVQVHTLRADGPKGTVFAVTYADYPESYRKVPAAKIIDGVRDGLLGTDGRAVKDEEVTLGSGDKKLTGREIRVIAGRRAIHARVYMSGTRLYEVMVTGSNGRMPESTVTAFLDSFAVLK